MKEKDAIDLIKKLLTRNPVNRAAGGFEFIKHSKYFEGFLWDDLENGRMKSPYVPQKFRKKTQKIEEMKGCPLTEFLKYKTENYV